MVIDHVPRTESAVWGAGVIGPSLRLHWRVGNEHRSVFKRFHTEKSKIRTTLQILEQALARIPDNRVNKYPIRVDLTGIRERLHQDRTAECDDVATGALFQL